MRDHVLELNVALFAGDAARELFASFRVELAPRFRVDVLPGLFELRLQIVGIALHDGVAADFRATGPDRDVRIDLGAASDADLTAATCGFAGLSAGAWPGPRADAYALSCADADPAAADRWSSAELSLRQVAKRLFGTGDDLAERSHRRLVRLEIVGRFGELDEQLALVLAELLECRVDAP